MCCVNFHFLALRFGSVRCHWTTKPMHGALALGQEESMLGKNAKFKELIMRSDRCSKKLYPTQGALRYLNRKATRERIHDSSFVPREVRILVVLKILARSAASRTS